MNREEWLNLVADGMAPWFEDQGYPLPRCRTAIGFPSTGTRGKRIGECWDGQASADGTFEALRFARVPPMDYLGKPSHPSRGQNHITRGSVLRVARGAVPDVV